MEENSPVYSGPRLTVAKLATKFTELDERLAYKNQRNNIYGENAMYADMDQDMDQDMDMDQDTGTDHTNTSSHSRNRPRRHYRRGRQPRPLSDVTCFNCHKKGHYASACPDNDKNKLRFIRCARCAEMGHRTEDCPVAKAQHANMANESNFDHVETIFMAIAPNPEMDRSNSQREFTSRDIDQEVKTCDTDAPDLINSINTVHAGPADDLLRPKHSARGEDQPTEAASNINDDDEIIFEVEVDCAKDSDLSDDVTKDFSRDPLLKNQALETNDSPTRDPETPLPICSFCDQHHGKNDCPHLIDDLNRPYMTEQFVQISN